MFIKFAPIIIGVALTLTPSWAVRKATGLSAKGIEHLKNGQYTRSKKVLSEALKKTLVSGREDWVIKASLNMVDLELTAFNLQSASEYLANIPESENQDIKAIVAWKKGQLAFYQGEQAEAERQLSTARELCQDDSEYCPYIWLDFFRIRAKFEKASGLKEDWEQFLKSKGKEFGESASDINALIHMQNENYSEANTEWDKAISMYRESGRLSAMAHCQNKKALSLLALGKFKEADELNQQAVLVFNAMGLKKRSLQCQVLNLFFPEQYRSMDKIQNNLDIVGLKIDDWEIQFAIKNYQHLAPVILSVDINSP